MEPSSQSENETVEVINWNTGDKTIVSREDWNKLLADVEQLKEDQVKSPKLSSTIDNKTFESVWTNTNPAPLPPIPPPPPPLPPENYDSREDGWMKWLLPLLALVVLAVGMWYFSRDNNEVAEVPEHESASQACRIVTFPAEYDDQEVMASAEICNEEEDNV